MAPDDADENLSPREHYQRALREKRARQEAPVEYVHLPECLCSDCLLAWRKLNGPATPRRRAKVPLSVAEAWANWYERGGRDR